MNNIEESKHINIQFVNGTEHRFNEQDGTTYASHVEDGMYVVGVSTKNGATIKISSLYRFPLQNILSIREV